MARGFIWIIIIITWYFDICVLEETYRSVRHVHHLWIAISYHSTSLRHINMLPFTVCILCDVRCVWFWDVWRLLAVVQPSAIIHYSRMSLLSAHLIILIRTNAIQMIQNVQKHSNMTHYDDIIALNLILKKFHN